MYDNTKRPPQKTIFTSDLAGYLIMLGHHLYRQKKDYKKPSRWVYFFTLDDTLIEDMLNYSNFNAELRDIRSKSLDKTPKSVV